MNPIEETQHLNLDFQKLQKIVQNQCEVVPVIVQDFQTQKVLMLAYTNDLALQKTIQTRRVHFWSTSKNQLWLKGNTSNNGLELHSIAVNCEQNSLLYQVQPMGSGVCHTQDQNKKYRSTCFYRLLDQNNQLLEN